MYGLIADADFLGSFRRILEVLLSDEWIEYWDELGLAVEEFGFLGLSHDASDRLVWERCQETGLILVTGNRNNESPDSLEATIRSADANALPVFTVGDARRVLEEGSYARVVALDLLDYLFTLHDSPDLLLGIGRIYLPKNAV